MNLVAALAGDAVLPLLDFRVVEFFNLATLQADEVVVMMAFVELEDGLAGFKVMAFEQAGLLELGEDAVNGGQADVHVLGDEQTVHVFRGEVTIVGLLEEVEDLEPRRSGLEADVLEVLGIAGHGGPGTCTRWPAGAASPI